MMNRGTKILLTSAVLGGIGYQVYHLNKSLDDQEAAISNYFKNKTVLITGASKGIGKGLALRLAKYRTNLILCATSEDLLNQVADECMKRGAAGVCVVKCDVTVEEQCKNVVEKGVQMFGGLDCLILNAGISGSSPFEMIEDLSVFEKMMKVNFMGYVHFVKYSLNHLKNSKFGRIGVVSSISGRVGVPFRTSYCASKYAVNGFFDVLRNELNDSVKIILLTPGWVDTDIRSRHVGEAKGMESQYQKKNMMSVDEMVQKSLYAIAIGKREERFDFLQKLTPFLSALSPSLLDKILKSKVKIRSKM